MLLEGTVPNVAACVGIPRKRIGLSMGGTEHACNEWLHASCLHLYDASIGSPMSDSAKAKGGHARAASMTREERKAIARRAAEARWTAHLPEAYYEGDFDLAAAKLSCAVLEDERRIITQAGFLRSLGRARSPKAGTGVLTTADEVPFFLRAEILQPFIDEEIIEIARPVFYRSKSGGKGVGYNALALKRVAEIYLRYRDHCLETSGSVPARYAKMIKAADMIIRGLAEVGIIALVDEATGYQDVRARRALQELLDQYLRKELAAWAKRFPDEFYKEIFRLRGWPWRGRHINPPQVVAHYTTDFIYDRLAPGITEELQRRMPKTEGGAKKGKLHQLLSDDIGHPALAQHLHAVMALMRASSDWETFKLMLDRSLPKRGATLELPLGDAPSRKTATGRSR